MDPNFISKNSQKKVVVIGAGFAGLSAASYLVNSGYHVEVIESSPKAGGRAYSLKDKDSDSTIDNGQHILMGCYSHTLDFLKLIGAENKFIFQDKLEVLFVKENLNLFPLSSSGKYYPFNLAAGMLKYKAVPLLDRLRMLKVFLMLPLYSSRDLEKQSIDEWLSSENQSEEIKKAFWEILAIGALNTNIKKASAKVFVDILKQIFLKGNRAATIVLPKEGLSESYANHALDFIKSKGGEINTGETVQSIVFSDSKAKAIKTNLRTITGFDYIVSTVPLYAFKKFMPKDFNLTLPELEYSSILTLHCWLKENNLKEKFYGLIDSPVHWVFNHGEHVTIVISDADRFMDKSKEEIFNLISAELQKYLLIECDNIVSYKVIKEKRATFIPSNSILNQRPPVVTEYKNFFIAGDWVNTSLPSTIESAVKSARLAADIIAFRISDLEKI